MELELRPWGDGRLRLSFEDRIEGKDRHFILESDGTAYEEREDKDCAAIDLVTELRALYDEISQRT